MRKDWLKMYSVKKQTDVFLHKNHIVGTFMDDNDTKVVLLAHQTTLKELEVYDKYGEVKNFLKEDTK